MHAKSNNRLGCRHSRSTLVRAFVCVFDSGLDKVINYRLGDSSM